MSDHPQTLAEFINYWTGGIGATVTGALIGRMMWHAYDARKKRRRYFGPELFWEVPVAIGMAFIGEAVSGWMQFGSVISTGLVASFAYYGPRGLEVMFMRWLERKLDTIDGPDVEL